jgi:tetratricopeptide (TPR) repeat protein
MKKAKTAKGLENSSTLYWLFLGAASVTLYFNPSIQDPFNAPKLWLLLIVSFWMIGHIATNIAQIKESKTLLIFSILVTIFSLFALISALNTDVKYTAFFGENLRRNGYLTYLSLSIIAISAALYVRFSNIKRLITISAFVGLVLVVYGLIQNAGNDFVQWNNPYNSIIVTVGNPNFAAALMAIMATLVFSLILLPGSSNSTKIISIFLVLALALTIYLSDARQGLISLFVGIGLSSTIYFWSKYKKFGKIILLLFSTSVFISILGILQIGPLKELLYKGSVSIRGYYWRAGLEMLKSHPLFGVGSDRYGAYFKEYRETGYVLNHGFDITSTNAHNVPIQIFGTGGIFVGIAYLSIIGYVIYRAIKTIRSASGAHLILFSGVFAAWVAYQAQSIVSIDNIGLSIWGWLLAGSVIGLSTELPGQEKISDSSKTKKLGGIKVAQPVTSTIFLISAIILSSILYRGELTMYQTRATYNPENPSMKNYLRDYAYKTLNTPLIEPYYKLTASSYLVGAGFIDEGLIELKKLNKSDPRNLDVLNFLAGLSEQIGDRTSAINYRLEIAKYDPWNAKNYLALGRIYKNLGDSAKASEMVDLIKSFAPKDPIALQAESELLVG